MLKLLVRLAAAWTVLGLASGLYFRELTKHFGLDAAGQLAGTQLAVVHTHVLVLGSLMMLILLVLVAQFRGLGELKSFRWGVWLWQAGLVFTTVGMLVIGTMQVSGAAGANSPALAGVSGMGHILLTVAFGFLFWALFAAVKEFARPASAT